MSCVSTRRRVPGRARGGYTLIEILIALAITSAFLGGVYAVVIQILREQDAAEARAEAVRNGRVALSMLGDDLQSVVSQGANVFFQLVSDKLAYGDRIDNDGDGRVDEDGEVDGRQDADATGLNLQAGRASFGGLSEHPMRPAVAEIGDRGVDQDCVFGQDKITFIVGMKAPTPGVKAVSYFIAPDPVDGQANVLVREVAAVGAGGAPGAVERTTPVAFGVLGFDVLCWDPNSAPAAQGWLSSWNSFSTTFKPNDLKLPASVYVRLTLAADPTVKDGAWHGERPVQTLVLESMVNLESVITNPKYPNMW